MREAIETLGASRIREVANAGIGREDVLAFWFGESDEVTPEPVRQAAAESSIARRDLLCPQPGPAGAARRLAAYMSSLHAPLSTNRVAITSSGVTALMLAAQLLLDPGDEVVAVVPVWPNLTAQPAILGARVTEVPLLPAGQGPGHWIWTWLNCWRRSLQPPGCCWSMHPTTPPAGR
jgi:aspartate/methionine/tyrosine aminotransferase